MNTRNGINTKLAVLAVMGTLLLSLATLASAQSDAVRQLYVSAANVQTNIAGIHTYAEPPKGFNPVGASDEELATYGFPPRPDKQAAPDLYAQWEHAMLRAKIRSTAPLKPMAASSREMMPAGRPAAAPSAGPSTTLSFNWSGVASTNTRKTFSSLYSFTSVISTFNVPRADWPFGACGNGITGPFWEVSWNGIDGFGSGDVLQGGSSSYIDCSLNNSYAAWVEWYPSYPIVAVFSVLPGDDMYVQTYDTLGGFAPGNVYVEDLTSLTYNTYSLTYISGPPLVGNSAEWIVERPCCNSLGNGYPYALANTIDEFFAGSWANLGNGKQLYPGSTSLATFDVTMVDDGDTQAISLVSAGSAGVQGKYSLLMQTTGCAFTPGCVPK